MNHETAHMRILVVTPELPYPLDQGGRIRMFNILKQLSERHEVHLVAIALSPTPPVYLNELNPYCKSLHLVPHYDSWCNRIIRIIKSILTQRPFVVYKHASRSLQRIVRSVVTRERPEVALVEFHYIANCVEGINLPRVVDMHNVDYVLYERFARNPRFGLKKIHGWIQRPLIYNFERQIPRRFDACVAVSKKDAIVLRNVSGASNITVVPNGVDTEYFKPSPKILPLKYDLVYVGSMNYYPNIDAVLWLCREIMPLIWQRRPQTTLAIVGRNPPNAVEVLQTDSRIRVTGTVADVRPYWSGASVVILPIRIGSGTKLKVLEAAAMGQAMVGTSVAFEGIDFENARHAVYCEQVDELATAVLDLLEDDEKRKRLGLSARQFVCKQYSWSSCVRQLEQVLECVRQGKQAR